MAIISTFDPRFQKKTLEKNIERHGQENIVHISKSKLFLWLKVVIPGVFWTLLLVLALTITLSNVELEWLLISMSLLFIWMRLIPIFKVIKYYLDYKMDFVIIKPNSLVRYNQEWFFKRISKSIELENIRSISVRKSGFVNSIFNNWELVFLSEAGKRDDDEYWNVWEIVFRYVYHPDMVNSKISKLLAKL